MAAQQKEINTPVIQKLRLNVTGAQSKKQKKLNKTFQIPTNGKILAITGPD